MNIRKLQQTGGKNGSSFLIILPKKWVETRKLGKGDSVVITEREDGCLIIDPRLQRTGGTRSTSIPMEANLRWAVTASYLLGFNEIKVIATKQITNAQRDELKRIIKRFVALEVTDETDHQIVIQCLVDPAILPVGKAMRRMNLIASRMLGDAMDAFIQGSREAAEEVIQTDEEVDRMFFLTVRELRSAIQYPSISEAMGLTPVAALDFRLAVQYLERIADLAVEIAERTDAPIAKKIANKLEPIASQVKEMLTTSVSNLFKFNTEKVGWVIQAEKDLIKDIAKIRQDIISSPEAQPQIHVIDSLLRIGEAAKDITDLALPEN
ncbi:MAG: PhoU domain-containing protein [Candidatus Thorarchaeota archaeon]